MYKGNPQKLSWIISIGVHVILALILSFITVSFQNEPAEFVTVGFGTYGNISKSGIKGSKKKANKSPAKKQSTKKKTKPKPKKVELPKASNKSSANIIRNRVKKIKSKTKAETKTVSSKKKLKKGKGNEKTGTDKGSTGFKIDFGGSGIRKIYSYTLPKYPGGVSKEIDIKLKFSILPDGTVGKVFPLIKADASLEAVSIASLRQWRFEPLPKNMKQIEQKAVIVFPYRLR